MALIEFGDDFDANKIGTGGLPKAGKCHLLVTEVDEKDGYFSVTHEILAHEDDSQVGKITYNSFQLSGKGSQRAFLFLIAVGLTTREALAEQATGGAAAEIDLADAVGKTYLGTLAKGKNPNSGKETCKVEWDFRRVDAEDSDDYPKNAKFLPKKAAPAPAKKESNTKTKPTAKAATTPPANDIPF